MSARDDKVRWLPRLASAMWESGASDRSET